MYPPHLIMQKTKPTKKSDIKRGWHLYDVSGKILGRVASEIATVLRGKGKPYFVPNLDLGDFVVVINAQKIKVTGDKKEKKFYTRYSGYPGGLKTERFQEVLEKHPDRIIYRAVSGMLPDNKLKDRLLKRLYIYPGSEYPYKDKFKTKEQMIKRAIKQ